MTKMFCSAVRSSICKNGATARNAAAAAIATGLASVNRGIDARSIVSVSNASIATAVTSLRGRCSRPARPVLTDADGAEVNEAASHFHLRNEVFSGPSAPWITAAGNRAAAVEGAGKNAGGGTAWDVDGVVAADENTLEFKPLNILK